MAKFANLLKNVRAGVRPMVLIASLPKNDPALAEAALEGGADVVKVHINLHHHASGTHFGPFAQERDAIAKIVALAGEKPVGIVPGATPDIDAETFAALPEMGLSFLSLYLKHARVGALPPLDNFDRMLALSYEDGPEVLDAFDRLPVQVCEVSTMHPDSYGEAFTYHDLARIAAVARCVRLPLVLPTQHKVTPAAVEDLLQVGVSAVMIGAIVAGDTPEQWRRVSAEFRKKMDEVWR
jgi:hypothetical protein